MPVMVMRLGVLILVVVLLWILTWSGRRFVEMRRRQALAAAPLDIMTAGGSNLAASSPAMDSDKTRVRILAFQSEDCRQCHTLQAPALKRLLETCGDAVAVVEVDAPGAPELTQRYRVLTLPTTVVLDASGNARAVNYGFAPTQRLLEQVNSVLAG
jgi:thioredoxin-like negative regulator of GroEL